MNEQIHDTQESNEPQATPEERMEAFISDEDSENEQPETEVEASSEVLDEEVDEEISAEADETEQDEEITEEEQESEDQPEDTPTYLVKAHGEEKEVTVDELIKSYQLGTDYTKKTQELAEQRKQLEAEQQKASESIKLQQEYAHKLDQLNQVLQQGIISEEELEKLRENDPIQYAIKVAENTETVKKQQQIQLEHQKLMQQQQKQQEEYLQKVVQGESQKIAELIPEFSDKTKGEQLRSEIRNFGKSIGFTNEELSQVYDSRHVNVLYKAMKYDRLMKNKAKVTKKVSDAPKMVKSKAKMLDTKTQSYRNQRKALRDTGDSNVAVSVFESILNN